MLQTLLSIRSSRERLEYIETRGKGKEKGMCSAQLCYWYDMISRLFPRMKLLRLFFVIIFSFDVYLFVQYIIWNKPYHDLQLVMKTKYTALH